MIVTIKKKLILAMKVMNRGGDSTNVCRTLSLTLFEHWLTVALILFS